MPRYVTNTPTKVRNTQSVANMNVNIEGIMFFQKNWKNIKYFTLKKMRTNQTRANSAKSLAP